MTWKKVLMILTKRRDHLEKRIDENHTRNLSFDEAEVEALNKVCVLVEEKLLSISEEKERYERQEFNK